MCKQKPLFIPLLKEQTGAALPIIYYLLPLHRGRTWITGYDTPCWGPYMYCGANEIDFQARGLRDAGLDGGSFIWNAANELQRYYDFSWAWHSYE